MVTQIEHCLMGSYLILVYRGFIFYILNLTLCLQTALYWQIVFRFASCSPWVTGPSRGTRTSPAPTPSSATSGSPSMTTRVSRSRQSTSSSATWPAWASWVWTLMTLTMFVARWDSETHYAIYWPRDPRAGSLCCTRCPVWWPASRGSRDSWLWPAWSRTCSPPPRTSSPCPRPMVSEGSWINHDVMMCFARVKSVALQNCQDCWQGGTDSEHQTELRDSAGVQQTGILQTPRGLQQVRSVRLVTTICHNTHNVRFYRCVKFNQYENDYTIFEYGCPEGLVFDDRSVNLSKYLTLFWINYPRWEVCVWPAQATPCDGSSEIFPIPKEDYKCPGPGFFVDPENCRWFFACLDHLGDGTYTHYEFRWVQLAWVIQDQELVFLWQHLQTKSNL